MRSRKEKEMGGVIVSIFAVAFLPKWFKAAQEPRKSGAGVSVRNAQIDEPFSVSFSLIFGLFQTNVSIFTTLK